jgi:pyruvate formate lyase activating enzyme
MIIGGLEKLTLLDYPEHLAAIIFTQGCNFRCHYCYNPLLVLPQENGADKKNKKDSHLIKEEDLFNFLKERFGRLEGVVITGGEPTLHSDLPEFIKKIKDLGYMVKLDTNGTNPEMLKQLINKKLIDYVAMDIKAPLEYYKKAVNVEIDFKKLQESVKIIMTCGLPYEFRTTVVPGILDEDDFYKMGEEIAGAKKWYLQSFKSDTELVDPSYGGKNSYTSHDMEKFAAIGKKFVDICEVRV